MIDLCTCIGGNLLQFTAHGKVDGIRSVHSQYRCKRYASFTLDASGYTSSTLDASPSCQNRCKHPAFHRESYT